MTNTNTVASELDDSGFKVHTIKLQAIAVSLTNRKVNQMEVREVLGQKFEGIKFELISTSDGVLVIV